MPLRGSIDQPPPPTDLGGVLHVLAQVNDPAQIAAALNVLLELKNLPIQEEGPATDLIAKTLPHSKLCHKDARVRSGCVRVLGRLISCPGILQSKLISGEQYSTGAWACLAEFSDVYGAYKEAVGQLASTPPPEVKRGAAKLATASDLEGNLPGPNKYTLEAALHTLGLMLSRGPRSVLEWLIGKQSTMTLLPLVQLLGHQSGRVQMRAAQVIKMICRFESARLRLLQVGCVAALLREASKNFSGTVRVEVVQALHQLLSCQGTQHLDLLEPGDRLTQPSHNMSSVCQLEGKDGVQILLGLLLSPENGHAKTVEEQLKEAKAGAHDASERGSTLGAPAPSTVAPSSVMNRNGKASPTPPYLGAPPLEFSKPQRTKPEDLQLASANALLSSCTFCTSSTQRLVALGGLQLLFGLLPFPPSLDPEGPPTSPRESGPPKDEKRCKGVHAVHALATITDLEEGSEACDNDAQALGAAETQDIDWTCNLVSAAFELPAQRALTPMIHRVVLKVLSHVLALPEVQGTLHTHAVKQRALADAYKAQAEKAAKAEAAQKVEPVGIVPGALQQSTNISGTQPQAGVGKGSKVDAPVPEQEQQQTGGKGGSNNVEGSRVTRDRWGRPAEPEAAKLLGTLHEVLLFTFAAALPPPPRPPSEREKREKEKEAAKKAPVLHPKSGRPMSEDMSMQEHMSPPFCLGVRAAAMECLVQLAKHEGYATLLAGSSQIKALVGRLGRSDELIIHNAPNDQPIRTSSPMSKGRSKAKGLSPSPPSSAGPRGHQGAAAAGAGQHGEGGKDIHKSKDGKVTTLPEPELVAPLASLLQLLIPHVSTASPQTDATPAIAPQRSRTAKLLGHNKASDTPAAQSRPIEVGLLRQDVVQALKHISAAAHSASSLGIVGIECVRLAVASAVLMLPQSDFMVRARPPLPSPPPTPPPQPLATSLFLWDALDRPQMTDGSVKLVHIA